MGEKISDLEIFHSDRIASRILGMGNVLSLIEKAQENVDKDEVEKLAQRMLKNQLLNQFEQMKKMMKQFSSEKLNMKNLKNSFKGF